MDKTTESIIEYFVIPCFLILTEAVTTAVMDRARRKKEDKSDFNRFTVRMPVIYNISLFAAFVIFTTITVFLNRQVSDDPDCISLSGLIILNIGMVALAVCSLVSAYVFIRIKVEINGDTAKVTPAFSGTYTFKPTEVTDIRRSEDKTKIFVAGKKFSVFRVEYCYNMFNEWLGW